LILVLWCGTWSDFFNSYILDNIRYAGANKFPPDRSFSWDDAPLMLIELGSYAQNFNPFVLWVAGFGLCGSLLFPWFTKWHRRSVLFAAVATVVACCAAMAPGRPYMHYLQLIMFPVGLFGGLVAGAAWQDFESDGFGAGILRTGRGLVLGMFLICGLAPQFWWRTTEAPRFLGRFTETHGAIAQSEVSREIL